MASVCAFVRLPAVSKIYTVDVNKRKMKPAIEKKLQHVSPETGSTLRNPDTRMKLLFFSYNL